VLVLDAHNTTTPGAAEFVVLVVGFKELLAEGLEISEIFLVHIGESKAGSCLHVAEFTEVALSADEAEGNILSAAESGKMDDGLNRVDIVGNHNQLSLVLFNEGGHVVETELDEHRLGASLLVLGLSSGLKAHLLVSLGLGRVLGEQLEELGGLVLVKSRLELGNTWGDLQALHENSLLSLNTDVLGPSHVTGKVNLGLDITTNTEVAGILLE